jgi:hypothetical protein
VRVQTTCSGWARWHGASYGSLLADAKEVGDKVAIDEEGSIGGKYCHVVLHVKPCSDSVTDFNGNIGKDRPSITAAVISEGVATPL